MGFVQTSALCRTRDRVSEKLVAEYQIRERIHLQITISSFYQRSIASTSQASLEAALRKRLEALGGCVELSTSLVGLREGENYAAAETIHRSPTGEPAATVTRKYASVVAADGAKGISCDLHLLCDVHPFY